jgi:hypothetical protein
MRLWALDTIHHAAFNNTVKCTSLHAPKCGLKYTPDCTRLYTPSLLDLRSQVSSQDASTYTPSTFSCTLPGMLSRTLLNALDGTLPACLTIRSKVSSQDAPKYIRSTLPSTPPSTFSCTLPGILPRTLPLALDGTHPACLTVRSHTSSQEALKHTPEHVLKYTPNCTR